MTIIVYLFIYITNYFIIEKLIFNISLIKILNNIILLHNDDVVDNINMIEKTINILKEIMYLLKIKNLL